MLVLIDNYDSFTYNLYQRLGEINPAIDVRVVRNDQVSVAELLRWQPQRLIVSPGPCTPSEAGISCQAIREFAGKIPVLGVCLGHQSIGQAFGARVVRASHLMHGKTDWIHHAGQGLYAGLDSPIQATRYHSLVVAEETIDQRQFEVDAWAFDPQGRKEVMGMRHRQFPLFGVQFHPESFLTHHGKDLLKAFLEVGM